MSEDYNRLPWIIDQLKRLNHMTVRVGALKATGGRSESYMEMIAMANENGVPHIRPKNGQWLTIPTKLAGTRRASEIPGLFKPKGKKILAKSNVNGKLDVYFYLTKEVSIPKRPFLENAFNHNVDTKWADLVERDVGKVMDDDMTAHEVMDDLGRQMVKDVQREIKVMKPGNAPATVDRKGSNNPLIDTGALYRSIDWTVDE